MLRPCNWEVGLGSRRELVLGVVRWEPPGGVAPGGGVLRGVAAEAGLQEASTLQLFGGLEALDSPLLAWPSFPAPAESR